MMTKNYLEFLLETSEKAIIKANGHIPQLCLMGSVGNLMTLVDDLPENSEERHKAFAMIGFTMATDPRAIKQLGDLKEIYFISEAWVSVQSTKDVDNNNFTMPRNDPKRKEVLIISVKDIEKKTDSMVYREILRSKEKVIGLGKQSKNEKVESHILDAFIKGYEAGKERYEKVN